MRRWSSLALALAVGAGVSYLVEVTQFYIPARDSGWNDVVSNATGGFLGGVLFEVCGRFVLGLATEWEDEFEGWLTPSRGVLLVVAYFTLAFTASAFLQGETRLSNWDPQASLFVGNDASGHFPWKGEVFELQIWNRALREPEIRRFARRKVPLPDAARTGLIASYDFSGSPPYRDKANLAPPLDWTPSTPQLADVRAPDFDAKSWLRTESPVENLTQEIAKTNRFTIHLVCAAGTIPRAGGRIVSISRSADDVSLNFRQQETNLVMWFRNPLTTSSRADLAWYVFGTFVSRDPRDIFAVYDGSDAYLYIDGNPVRRAYRLSPGASLISHFDYIQTPDLQGYVLLYQTLIFLPAGVLIGIGFRKWRPWDLAGRSSLILAWAVPPVLLEIFLAEISGRRIWVENMGLGLVFTLAGILLINSDRGFKPARASQPDQAEGAVASPHL